MRHSKRLAGPAMQRWLRQRRRLSLERAWQLQMQCLQQSRLPRRVLRARMAFLRSQQNPRLRRKQPSRLQLLMPPRWRRSPGWKRLSPLARCLVRSRSAVPALALLHGKHEDDMTQCSRRVEGLHDHSLPSFCFEMLWQEETVHLQFHLLALNIIPSTKKLLYSGMNIVICCCRQH